MNECLVNQETPAKSPPRRAAAQHEAELEQGSWHPCCCTTPHWLDCSTDVGHRAFEARSARILPINANGIGCTEFSSCNADHGRDRKTTLSALFFNSFMSSAAREMLDENESELKAAQGG